MSYLKRQILIFEKQSKIKFKYESVKTTLISYIQEPLINEYWVVNKYLTKQK